MAVQNIFQYRTSIEQAEKFRSAIKRFDALSLIKNGVDKMIADAQLQAMQSQLIDLEKQIIQFEEEQGNSGKRIHLDSFYSLGESLIKARIDQGLTQENLASRLGMFPQQIQRYEKTKYRSCSLRKLQLLIVALGLSFEAQITLLSEAE